MKILALTLALCALISCNKKDDDDDDSTTNTPDYKDTLSAWSVSPSKAWAVRLDLNGANLSGTPFTMIAKFADSSETHCANTVLAGSEANGTWSSTSCVVQGTGHMAASTGTSTFTTTGSGTYENTGSSLKLCRTTNGCTTYIP